MIRPQGKAGRVLDLLERLGPLTSSEIAAELDLTVHNASAHVCALAQRGYVKRLEAKRHTTTEDRHGTPIQFKATVYALK